jgi:hypothetical protein
VVTSFGSPPAAHAASGSVTRAQGPTEQRDAACRAVNTWLANNDFPERIDCNPISNDPDTICTDIQQALRAAGVTIHNCGTGSGLKPATDDHNPPCPDGAKGEKGTAPTAEVGLFGL